MTQRETVATMLTSDVAQEIGALLQGVDRDLAQRYPGDPGSRQPVHTVYLPGDAFTADTVRDWGQAALRALDEHAPDADALAAVLELPVELAGAVHRRVRAKLEREPVEDLRIDFEDGYGHHADAEEDATAARAARLVAQSVAGSTAPPYLGIRIRSLEAADRERAIRTLDVFLTAVLAAGDLPAGLRLTLPKVSRVEQVTAMVQLCIAVERAHRLPTGRLTFELQIETTQSILGPDGRATVARMIDAAQGRVTGLHYGTFDYSAGCGISAAYQSSDHPVADHAKAVMQVAAAGTGVRLSDGSTHVLPTGSRERVHEAWRLHYRLVRRALARGYYQGWDLHPGQLPVRYAAVYAFHRGALPDSTARLADYVQGHTGGVQDEPATVRALSGQLLRGLDCGALDLDEVSQLSGLTRDRLAQLAGRRAAVA